MSISPGIFKLMTSAVIKLIISPDSLAALAAHEVYSQNLFDFLLLLLVV